VNVSLWLLTAAVSAGAGDAQPCPCAADAAQQPRVIMSSGYVPERTGPFAGLRSVFRPARQTGMIVTYSAPLRPTPAPQPQPRQIVSPYAHVGPPATFPTAAAPSATPEPPLAVQEIQPTAAKETAVKESAARELLSRDGPPELRQDVRKENRDKIGAASDYSWITGQLIYVHANGGVWVLRYAPLEQTDKYGGSVILTTPVSMKNFREGDVVYVEGEVLDSARPSKQLGGALYRATAVNMIERAD
jgi:hypothetical protein